MKNVILVFAIMFASSFGYSQSIKENSNLDSNDIRYMFEILGVNCFKFELDEQLIGKPFQIIVKNYVEGKLVGEPVIFNFSNVSENVNEIKLFTEKKAENRESLQIKILNQSWVFDNMDIKYNRQDYKWLTLLNDDLKIDFGIEIPLITFTDAPRATDDPNFRVFCALPQVANQYEDWYSVLSVKQFYIFFIKFS